MQVWDAPHKLCVDSWGLTDDYPDGSRYTRSEQIILAMDDVDGLEIMVETVSDILWETMRSAIT